MSQDKNFLIETHSIDFIPHELRHGKTSDLFFLWFGANTQMAVITTGIMAMVPGFNLWWAVIGIIIGTLFGSIFMAYHSAQGPHLGIPQMIQSRAQFGYYGATIPLIMVVLMYLGWFGAGAVIGAEAISQLFHVSVSAGIIISSIADLLLVLAGYNLIHKFNRVMSYFFSVIFLVITALLIFDHPFSQLHHVAIAAPGSFQLGSFLIAISLAVINTLGYAPYVADYSRYLPEKSTIPSTFWYSYIGVSISNIWMMIIGAVVEHADPNSNPITGFVVLSNRIGPWFNVLVLIAIALGIVSINALNIYGGFISSLTIVSTFFNKMKSSFTLRARFIIPITIIGTILGILSQGSFLNNFMNFLSVLIDFLAPWTAINLTDYYLLRRGKYDIDAIFNPNGMYGKISWVAFTAYFGAFILEIPFMNTPIYEGPIAKALQNADISWIIGLVAAGISYWFLSKKYQEGINAYLPTQHSVQDK